MESRVWRIILLIYIATFLISIPWSILLHKYGPFVSDIWVNTQINKVFVVYGYVWFTIVFLSGSLEYMPNLQINEQVIRIGKIYMMNSIFGLISIIWCFGPSIYERIDVGYGGYCEETSGGGAVTGHISGSVSGTIPGQSAGQSAGKAEQPIEDLVHLFKRDSWKNCENWISKFDASGHYYLLLSMSLLVWYQLLKSSNRFLKRRNIIDVQEREMPKYEFIQNWVKKVWFGSCVGLLVIWYVEFIITSLFFHTILEKLVGMVFGLFIPIIVYVYF